MKRTTRMTHGQQLNLGFNRLAELIVSESDLMDDTLADLENQVDATHVLLREVIQRLDRIEAKTTPPPAYTIPVDPNQWHLPFQVWCKTTDHT
jgi:hypothetical protein